MTDERIEELLLEISQKVSAINVQLSNANSIISNHENRISVLEKHPSNQSVINNGQHDDFKTELMRLLAKCLAASLVIISSLVGASSLVTKFIDTSNNSEGQGSTQNCNRAQ